MPRLLRKNHGSNPASNDGDAGNMGNEAAVTANEAAGQVDGGTRADPSTGLASVSAVSAGVGDNVVSTATPSSARGRKRKKSSAADGENEGGGRSVTFDVLMFRC